MPQDLEGPVLEAAQIVNRRLVDSGGKPGIKFLGKDRFGNTRAESKTKTEFDLAIRREVPARIIITPQGRKLASAHPHLLRTIASGDFKNSSLNSHGGSSLVVHPKEYPEVVIKYMKFYPGSSGNLTSAQVGTGIDQLYWKEVAKEVLAKQGLSVATPFFATHDVLVEEFVEGRELFDFMGLAERANPTAVNQLIESVTEITDHAHEELLKYIKENYDIVEYKLDPENGLFNFPNQIDISPTDDWKSNPFTTKKGMRIRGHSSLHNWILRGNSDDIVEKFSLLSKEEQQKWLKEHLVLIDPFALFGRHLKARDFRKFQHFIGKPLDLKSDEETKVSKEDNPDTIKYPTEEIESDLIGEIKEFKIKDAVS